MMPRRWTDFSALRLSSRAVRSYLDSHAEDLTQQLPDESTECHIQRRLCATDCRLQPLALALVGEALADTASPAPEPAGQEPDAGAAGLPVPASPQLGLGLLAGLKRTFSRVACLTLAQLPVSYALAAGVSYHMAATLTRLDIRRGNEWVTIPAPLHSAGGA
jgi:hypothetical protein